MRIAKLCSSKTRGSMALVRRHPEPGLTPIILTGAVSTPVRTIRSCLLALYCGEHESERRLLR
jgi:hypothetical protein